MFARQLGTYARYESEIKSERILGKVAQLVKDGGVHNGGPRPYGFTRLYQGEGPRRKILGDLVNEEEAERIREWAARFLEGESLYSLVAEANQNGLLTSTGKPWSIQAMRFMLMSGRIAGLKEHHREVIGKAAWDPIITEEQHRLLRAKLGDPKRFSGGLRGARKFPLTGLVRCACKDLPGMTEDERDTALLKMKPRKRNDRDDRVYICQLSMAGGCARAIKMSAMVDHVTDLLLAHLEGVEAAEDDPVRAELETKLLGYEQRLEELKEEYAEGDHSAKEYKGLVGLINGKIGDTQALLARRDFKRRVEVSADELRAAWESEDGPPLERKRAVFTGLIRFIAIHPATMPYSVFNPARIEVVWR
jgi:site-specific DNA recombinase